ncbi:AraC family transcriptional regulator [Ulvibacterium sp.]|uniref:AraC family transcriptional regulator n=1 Tax=Ulvibacterium sp. TaxID=2665914 RepID=UPI003BA9A704
MVELDGATILESCHDGHYEVRGTAYTAHHEILHVVSGNCKLHIAHTTIEISAGETMLIPKQTILKYLKTGRPYRSLLFFLKDEFLLEFLKNNEFQNSLTKPTTPFMVFGQSEMLTSAFQSMLPYIRNSSSTGKALFKIKTFEILINLSQYTKSLPSFLSDMAKPSKIDLRLFMETMYSKKIPIKELASLSGRSLSSFKREFREIFNTSPFKWIKEKRLELAHDLIAYGSKKPMEIYLEVGFEDYSHFSKSYKTHFGYLPSHTTRIALEI